MFKSLDQNSTINAANNLTYLNDSKFFKTILKSRFYVKINGITEKWDPKPGTQDPSHRSNPGS